MIEVNSSLWRLLRFVFADGVLVEEIEVAGHDQRLDGRPRARSDALALRGGPAVADLTTDESGAHPGWGGPERGPYWQARAHGFAYDADGELAVITTYAVDGDLADGGDVEAGAVRGARADAGTPRVAAALRRPHAASGDQLPDPAHAYDGLGESLADALLLALQPHVARLARRSSVRWTVRSARVTNVVVFPPAWTITRSSVTARSWRRCSRPPA